MQSCAPAAAAAALGIRLGVHHTARKCRSHESYEYTAAVLQSRYSSCWRVSTAPDICGFGAGGEADDPDYTVSAYAASKISEIDAEILKYAPSLEELNKEVGKVRYQI